MLATLRQDLRLAARLLWSSPLFTLVAVACIAIGSGAVTTIVSAGDAMVLRPLAGSDDGSRLIRIERKQPGGSDGVSLSYPWYTAMRDASQTLGGVAAWGKASLVLRGGSGPGDAVYGSLVSGNLFEVVGVRPLLGRFFLPEEDRTELSHPVLVVSERYWRAHLGADSAAVGRDLLVNGRPFTLIGVAPAAFRGMDDPILSDAWLPLHMQRAVRPHAGGLSDAGDTWLRAAARLRDGTSPAAAQAELTALAAPLVAGSGEPQWAAQYSELRVSPLTGLPPDATGPLAQFLALLLGAAALVLVIASVNVAAMLSARAVRRQRELAVRSALGATPGRLTRQLLTEILLLFGLGAAGGMLVATVATAALERLPLPTEIPLGLELSPDLRVLGVALLLALGTGLVVGLAPVRQALALDVVTRLKEGSAGSGRRRSLGGSALIVAQLAISLVLLVGAGLLGRGLLRAARVDPGFEVQGVATVPVDVEAWGLDEAAGRRFFDALDQRLPTLPGVTASTWATELPLTFHSSGAEVSLDGAREAVPISQVLVGPGYLDVLRIPLVAGRDIGREDTREAGRVALINETMARRLWPDGAALGRSFRYNDQPVTVIGVARDAKYASLTEATPALAYFPLAQEWRARRALLVRTAGDLRALAPLLAQAVRAADPAAPRVSVTPLAEASQVAFLPGRVAALVTGVLGFAGLLLSVAGLYGVISYSAARRTREIGIRLALGAGRREVLGLVLGEGMRLTAVGLLVGLPLAAAAAPLVRSLLFGMPAHDAVTFAAMPLLLAAVALLASYLPARRAAALEPWKVLREE
ncbi:MAG: ABC transporter permease [Gemmatimonadales bacterium]|nr:ABC transporter permease [Gemmatimonadales bacterium]